MKMKQLTMAVAAASVVVSGAAVAGGHGDPVTTALANAKVSGEVYGAYRNGTTDSGSGETEISDFDIDELRLGLTTNVHDNKEFGIELGWIILDGPGNNSATVVRDLYGAKSYGNTVVTVGRFKQIADRDNYMEQSDALFNDGASIGTIGADRRIDGVEVKTHVDGGLHGSLSVYKGGVDTEITGADTEISRNLGFAASGGWQGGNDDMSFGVTLTVFQQDGNDPGGFDTDGFGVSTFIATGPLTGTLSYADNESDPVGGGTKTENDGFQLMAALDLGGAARSFDQYGVYQGPSLGEDGRGYEAVISFGSGDSETGTTESETDGWGIGFNMYCGPYTKWFIQYTDSETEIGSAKTETDGFAIGGRLDF